MLQEAQVIGVVLDPRDLEVAVHVGAVRVAVAQVLVVEFSVGGHRHASICTNAYWKEGEMKPLVREIRH